MHAPTPEVCIISATCEIVRCGGQDTFALQKAITCTPAVLQQILRRRPQHWFFERCRRACSSRALPSGVAKQCLCKKAVELLSFTRRCSAFFQLAQPRLQKLHPDGSDLQRLPVCFPYFYIVHYCCVFSVELGRLPLVKTAAKMARGLCYNNKDRLMAGMIIAGWDPVEGGTVYEIPLGGTMIKQKFAIGGSGSTYM